MVGGVDKDTNIEVNLINLSFLLNFFYGIVYFSFVFLSVFEGLLFGTVNVLRGIGILILNLIF